MGRTIRFLPRKSENPRELSHASPPPPPPPRSMGKTWANSRICRPTAHAHRVCRLPLSLPSHFLSRPGFLCQKCCPQNCHYLIARGSGIQLVHICRIHAYDAYSRFTRNIKDACGQGTKIQFLRFASVPAILRRVFWELGKCCSAAASAAGEGRRRTPRPDRQHCRRRRVCTCRRWQIFTTFRVSPSSLYSVSHNERRGRKKCFNILSDLSANM